MLVTLPPGKEIQVPNGRKNGGPEANLDAVKKRKLHAPDGQQIPSCSSVA
jgi:hypothetical protein